MSASNPRRVLRIACVFAVLAAAALIAPRPALAQGCAVPGGYLQSSLFRVWRAIQIGDELVIYRPGDLASPVTGACSENCRSSDDQKTVTVLSAGQAGAYLTADGAAWAAGQAFSAIKLVVCADSSHSDPDRDEPEPEPSMDPPATPQDDYEERPR